VQPSFSLSIDPPFATARGSRRELISTNADMATEQETQFTPKRGASMSDTNVGILLVEDNPNDELLALHAFKKHNLANKVHVVRDGAEALEYVFCTGAYVDRPFENPRVILLDKKLPLVDGMEVLRQIRADPRTKLIPVVMLTSSAEDRDIIESYQLGVNSYIVKPVNFEQFSETARQLGYYWLLINKQPTD
jgi:two-component system, response regulator